MRHPTPEEMDHRRDLAKHDWRPGDPPEQRPAPDEQAAYAAAAERFVSGENNRDQFVSNLRELGFHGQDICQEISNALDECAEQAAYEAEEASYDHFNRYIAGDR